jgi:Fe2+ or Zn2+ uptake regulation protein
MSLKDRVYTNIVAELVCTECGDIEEAQGGSEESAENAVVKYASDAGWKEIDGKVHCKQCIKDLR